MTESTTEKIDRTRREVARCKKCKVGYQRTIRVKGSRTTSYYLGSMRTSYALDYFSEDGSQHITSLPRPCCKQCNKPIVFSPIKGRVVEEIKCGSRCTGATGPACDCSCGGANHGRGLGCA